MYAVSPDASRGKQLSDLTEKTSFIFIPVCQDITARAESKDKSPKTKAPLMRLSTLRPSTFDLKPKVVIAAGLTSSHPEQRS